METNKWYVGQKVWDKTVSDEAGEIISINDVQIVAKFFRNQWAYSLNGELIIVGRNRPTLSTTPYEIKMEGFSQEFEENNREPEIGDMVFAWSDEGEPPTYGELIRLSNNKAYINPLSSHLETFKHCSLKNPLIK